MGYITDDMHFVRSVEMENEVVRRITDLFTSQWEETSKKKPRELTALVLDSFIGACLTDDNAKDSPESLQLRHANQFFYSTSSLLRSESPLSVEIIGTTLDETLWNLRRLEKLAEKEEYSKDITARLDFFINKLQSVLEQMVQNQQKGKKMMGTALFIFAIYVVLIIGAFIWLAFFEGTAIPLLILIFLGGVTYFILNVKSNS